MQTTCNWKEVQNQPGTGSSGQKEDITMDTHSAKGSAPMLSGSVPFSLFSASHSSLSRDGVQVSEKPRVMRVEYTVRESGLHDATQAPYVRRVSRVIPSGIDPTS